MPLRLRQRPIPYCLRRRATSRMPWLIAIVSTAVMSLTMVKCISAQPASTLQWVRRAIDAQRSVPQAPAGHRLSRLLQRSWCSWFPKSPRFCRSPACSVSRTTGICDSFKASLREVHLDNFFYELPTYLLNTIFLNRAASVASIETFFRRLIA